MPTYIYKCGSPECMGEFEEFHSITIKLEFCPHCKEAGRGDQPVERLISGGSGRGIMSLTADEFKATLPNESRKITQQAMKNETFAENFVGKSKFTPR